MEQPTESCSNIIQITATDITMLDLTNRVPEVLEEFTDTNARKYIEACDFPETVDYIMLVWEIQRLLGTERLQSMSVLEAMCGPGRLGRDFLTRARVPSVTFHDGHNLMLKYAIARAQAVLDPSTQKIASVHSDVTSIPIPDNSFDLVIVQNSLHQLSNIERLQAAIKEMVRLTALGGFIVIADYHRSNGPDFKQALARRLRATNPAVHQMLLDTFRAAWSIEEFLQVLNKIQGISFTINDGSIGFPVTTEKQILMDADPFQGHVLDRSPITLFIDIERSNNES